MVVGSVLENKYGKYKIVEILPERKYRIVFENTKSSRIVDIRSLTSNNVKDYYRPCLCGVGYLGEMQGKTRENLKSYKTWASMLTRCYSEKSLKRCPTYLKVTVCKEWHNFTNFNIWFEENYIEGFELDKDLLSKGDKVYSPSTCKFISQAENSVLSSNMEDRYLISPEGYYMVVKNLSQFTKSLNLNYDSLRKLSLGKINSYKGWKSWKDMSPLEIIINWKENIPTRTPEENRIRLLNIKDSFTKRGIKWEY